MRHILINYAERRRATKSGGKQSHEPSDHNPIADDKTAAEFLTQDQALQYLKRLEPRQARVVECRFFAGLSVTKTTEVVGISEATVNCDWDPARAYLKREVTRG